MRLVLCVLSAVFVLGVVHDTADAKSKSKSKKSQPKQTKVTSRPDHEVRRLVRRQAPFMLEEKSFGEVVRINKDGTFVRDAEASTSGVEGHWKINNGRLKLKWTSGEEREYPVAFAGKNTLIGGKKPKDGRYSVTATTTD